MENDISFWMTMLFVQSFRTALLILAILLLRLFLGSRIPPAWRHAIWGLVPLQLLLIVSIPSSISLLNFVKVSDQTPVKVGGRSPDMVGDRSPSGHVGDSRLEADSKSPLANFSLTTSSVTNPAF